MAEYQARGVVHFHAVIRLDAPGDDYRPPPPGIDAAMLCDAVVRCRRRPHRPATAPAPPSASASAPAGPTCGPSAAMTWRAPGRPLIRQAVANYIAKYATKTLTVPGLPAQPHPHRPTSGACAARPTTSG